MFKAFIKHYLLIVISIVSSILIADYWYNQSSASPSSPVLEIKQIVPLINQYCQRQDCRNSAIPLSVPTHLIDKQQILFPAAQRQKLAAGLTVSVLDQQQGNYFYLAYDEKYYLQLGPIKVPRAEYNHLYTSSFYILLATALFLGFYPLFRDMARLSDVVRKFESKQVLNSNDFPNSAYFQQIFAAIRSMLEKTGRLVALQKELSDTLSHEVRTSLSSAKFTLSAMNDNNFAQMQPLLDGDIHDIERLVQEYLSFSKQEHQCPSLILVAQSPAPIIDEYVEKLLRFSDKKVNFTNHCSALALIDQRYFSRVVKNLIDNALKHARAEIAIGLYQQQNMLVLQIEDDGRGLQSDNFEDLFLPFNQEKDDVGGYGLGLAIAKKIIDWHQGIIIATNSQTLSGAKFIVQLPCSPTDNHQVCNHVVDQLSPFTDPL